MKIYILCMESNVDGNITFEVYPYSTLELARESLASVKKELLDESKHFNGADLQSDEYEVVDKEDRFFINDHFDDYYEDYYIKEKYLIEK